MDQKNGIVKNEVAIERKWGKMEHLVLSYYFPFSTDLIWIFRYLFTFPAAIRLHWDWALNVCSFFLFICFSAEKNNAKVIQVDKEYPTVSELPCHHLFWLVILYSYFYLEITTKGKHFLNTRAFVMQWHCILMKSQENGHKRGKSRDNGWKWEEDSASSSSDRHYFLLLYAL